MNLNTKRPRRNRKSEAIRAMVQETHILPSQLIYPFFLMDGLAQKIEISSMPGIFRQTVDQALLEAEECMQLGLRNFILFPAIDGAMRLEAVLTEMGPAVGALPRGAAIDVAVPRVTQLKPRMVRDVLVVLLDGVALAGSLSFALLAFAALRDLGRRLVVIPLLLLGLALPAAPLGWQAWCGVVSTWAPPVGAAVRLRPKV